jgi:hypothetical protein
MGKPYWHADKPADYTGKLSVSMVRLNGDYEPDGTYWGCHSPGQILYLVTSTAADKETVKYYLRAGSRFAARAMVLAKYPNAKVRR